MTGAVDRDMLATYFKILSSASESSQPESTRLVALHSLETFSPILHLAFENPETKSEIIPALFTLLLLLSDDNFGIRHSASEITSSILGEYMTSTPISASEKLAQSIGETFPPQSVERSVAGLVLENNVRRNLQTALQSDEDLFAKERDNVWRDEIHEWGLYMRILAISWSREMSLGLGPLDLGLENWATDGMKAIREVVDSKEDTPLGWSHDVDPFEAAVKLFMLVEIMLRYGRGKSLGPAIEQLRKAMFEKKCHGFWVKKMGELGSAKGVCMEREGN